MATGRFPCSPAVEQVIRRGGKGLRRAIIACRWPRASKLVTCATCRITVADTDAERGRHALSCADATYRPFEPRGT